MEMSEQVDQVILAMVRFQSEGHGIERNREVEVQMKQKPGSDRPAGKYKFKYSSLDHIMAQIRPHLADNGLAVQQFQANGQMVTRILHSSGQWMDCGLPMPNVSGSPQDIGSIISYFRRYSLSAALCLVTEEDDDAGGQEAGDRELNYNSSSRGQVVTAPQDTGIIVPDEGWGDWARKLISDAAGAPDMETLDTLKADNKRYINGCARVEKTIYADVAQAFTNRKAVLDDRVPF